MSKKMTAFIFLITLCGICVSGVLFYRLFIYPKEQIRDAEGMLRTSIPGNAENVHVRIIPYPAGKSMRMRLNLPVETTNEFIAQVCDEEVGLTPGYSPYQFTNAQDDWWSAPTFPYAGARCTPDDSRLIHVLVEYEHEEYNDIYITVTSG